MATSIDIPLSTLSSLPNSNVSRSIALDDSQKIRTASSAQFLEQKSGVDSQKKSSEVNNQAGQEFDQSIDSVALDALLTGLNSQLQPLQNYMKFERGEDSQKMVVFIKDSETDEVIRQVPTQEFLAMSKSITQYLEMRQQVSEKVSPPIGMITNETA